MRLGRHLFQGRKEQSFGFEKTCYLKTKGEKGLRMKKIEKKGGIFWEKG